MNKLFLSLFLAIVAVYACSQTSSPALNLGFEKLSSGKKLPDNWFQWGSGYNINVDTVVAHSGKRSALISPSESAVENSFGCIAYAIPADYDGKEIELRAFMKLQDVDEPIGLMLRIDGNAGSLAFDNMQLRKITGSSDWKQYSVKVLYPEQAKKIYVGAILSGSGRLWVDDFELYIDGVDISRAKHVKPREFRANTDKEFDGGSGILPIVLSSSKTEDLRVLGLVWGFLKYYHPDIAAGNLNWDYELFRILPGIIACNNATDRDILLVKWINRLPKVRASVKAVEIKGKVKTWPDLEWITGHGLSPELESALLEIQDCERSNENYYISFANSVKNPEFSHEEPYASLRYPDTGYRLLALYRYWNIIQYWFPYKNLIGEDWKNVLTEFIPKIVYSSDEMQYTLTMLELIGRVHDTHANIWGGNAAISRHIGLYSAGVKLEFIENKAVVTSLSNELSKTEKGIEKGDIILKVNGEPVDSIISSRLKLTPASNYPTKLRDIAKNLLRTNEETIRLEVAGQNGRKELTLITSRQPGFQRSEPDTCFKMITKDIAYINNGTLRREYLSQIWNEMRNSKGLVIDDRNYPSDFPIYALSSYLMPQSTPFVKFTSGNIKLPGLFTFEDSICTGTNNSSYYRGKVVILTNEISQSSAEFHAMAYRVAPGAKVFGSTTAGADGNVSRINLPGGISTMISGIGVYYPDGSETQRVGIIPDVEVRPTIKGIREGRDEVLERALDYISGK